jgi:hypothetical protein
MKNVNLIVVVIIILIEIISCKNSVKETASNELYTINADNTEKTIDLKLTDIADSFSLIPLETTEECLLDDRSDFYIGKNYILAYDKYGVFKFSTEGKFIKKLIGIGRGPNEFSNPLLCLFMVDEKKDLLYINDYGHKGFYLLYDLKSEQFLKPVKQCIPAYGFFNIENDSIIISSNLLNNSDYAIFRQNLNGEFLSGITNTKKYVSNQQEFFQSGRLIKADSVFYYYSTYDDTLFRIKNNKLVPTLALNFTTPRSNPPKATSENGDRFILFQSGMPGFTIICILIIEDINLYKLGRGGEKYYYLLFNNHTGKAAKINSYTDNFIGKTKDALALSQVDPSFPFFIKLPQNKKLVVAYSKPQIKDAIEKGLNNKDFPESINQQLILLNENLQETDNPILLIGKLKDKLRNTL